MRAILTAGVWFLCVSDASAWSTPKIQTNHPASSLQNGASSRVVMDMNANDQGDQVMTSRRQAFSLVAAGLSAATFSQPAFAVTRAIGGAEVECRAAGNCLETFELDGAVGWTWGGKDRCDAGDPRCGPDGKLRSEEDLKGAPVPDANGLKITHVVEIVVSVGRGRGEERVLRLGLYGEAEPESVKQFLKFTATRGLVTTSEIAFSNGMGVQTAPVNFAIGGVLNQIVPGQRLDFGVPSQSFAYARSKGMSKAGDDFLAQPRPQAINDEVSPRKHDVAGLLSVPAKGLGYGNIGFESDDECFGSAFQVTAAAVPAMDKEKRRVIGQLVDEESMESLQRLSSLSVKKGIKGVLPGQNSGPPLIAVRVETSGLAQ